MIVPLLRVRLCPLLVVVAEVTGEVVRIVLEAGVTDTEAAANLINLPSDIHISGTQHTSENT